MPTQRYIPIDSWLASREPDDHPYRERAPLPERRSDVPITTEHGQNERRKLRDRERSIRRGIERKQAREQANA